MSMKRSNRKVCKRSIEGELDLPTAIIQHIQSFMEDECSAHSSLISKLWYEAWSSRPVLILQNYSNRTDYKTQPEVFCNLARKAIQRYIDQNVGVDKLKINLNMDNSDFFHVDKIFSDASKLRMNELYLNDGYSSDHYNLPAQLIEQRYLRKIDLFGCKIDCQLAERVPWPRLVSLSLRRTWLPCDILWQILSRCPLIEHLELYSLPITTCNVSKLHNLKVLVVETDIPHKVSIEFGECQFLNLTRLVLKGDIDTAFFNNFAYKFPYLEDLTLEMLNRRRNQDIQISSRSIKFLEVLVSRDAKVEIAKFEVPNVSKFIFSCHELPTVSLTAATKLMESAINCLRTGKLEFPNFLIKLRNLLQDLHHSKISLNIEISEYSDYSSMKNIGTPPVVENLTVSYESDQIWRFSLAVCGILWCCRPKFMSILCGCDKTAIKVLHEKLIKQANRKRLNSVSTEYIRRLCALETSELSRNVRSLYRRQKSFFPNPRPRYLYDLEEVSVEVFEKSVMEWQPIKASLDASEIMLCGDEQLRFKLVWGNVTPEHTIVNFVKRPEPVLDLSTFSI